MAATVAALGGECSQAVVNDSAVAAAVAVDGARGVDSGASDTADSLGCLPPRLRSLCERYKVTVAEAASLLAWLFTGFSFVIAKRAFDDCSPLVRDERPERRACTREAPGAALSSRPPAKGQTLVPRRASHAPRLCVPVHSCSRPSGSLRARCSCFSSTASASRHCVTTTVVQYSWARWLRWATFCSRCL